VRRKSLSVFYPSEISVNAKARSARVAGDRILLVEGLRAASPLSVEVQYELGERTPNNPEGVYIVGEKARTLRGRRHGRGCPMKWLAVVSVGFWRFTFLLETPLRLKTPRIVTQADSEMVTINTALGYTTLIQFDARPTSAVLGDQDGF